MKKHINIFFLIMISFFLSGCISNTSNTNISQPAPSEEMQQEKEIIMENEVEIKNEENKNGLNIDPIPLPIKEMEQEIKENKAYTISYMDNGFDPNSLTINQGDTVIFMNNSSRAFWPASDIHPTHGSYPEKGGCIGSAFDACSSIEPNQTYSFTFNEKGTWGFHNHLRANYTGVIIVK